MRRSGRDAEKAMRKVKQAQLSGHSGAGPSLLSTLESHLLHACKGYIRCREWDQEDIQDGIIRVSRWRGEIRGLARAVAKIRLPYEDQSITIKQVEKEFIRKAHDGDSPE